MGGQASPYDTRAYYDQLAAEADERQRLEREQQDADYQTQTAAGLPGSIQARLFQQMSNSASDAATGRGGYNRQWVPFFEALRGKKLNVGSLDLPTSTYSDPNHTGHLEMERPSAPMPEGHDSWMKRTKAKIYGLKSAQTPY